MINLLLLLMVVLVTACKSNRDAELQLKTRDIVTQISKQSRLYTTEYMVHKIVTHKDMERLKGTFFGKNFNQDVTIGDRGYKVVEVSFYK